MASQLHPALAHVWVARSVAHCEGLRTNLHRLELSQVQLPAGSVEWFVIELDSVEPGPEVGHQVLLLLLLELRLGWLS